MKAILWHLFGVGEQIVAGLLDLLDDADAAVHGLVDVGAAVGLELANKLYGSIFGGRSCPQGLTCWCGRMADRLLK